MNWSKRVAIKQNEIENEQIERLITAGFDVRRLTEEEFEDGIGATAGLNAIRNECWYTFRQALLEIGDSRDARGIAIKAAS